jgi:hypothetical protein
MKELVAHALAMPHSLPGVLVGQNDWWVFDSAMVTLPRASPETFSGTGDYAALNAQVEMVLGVENVVAWHITEARRHDGPSWWWMPAGRQQACLWTSGTSSASRCRAVAHCQADPGPRHADVEGCQNHRPGLIRLLSRDAE